MKYKKIIVFSLIFIFTITPILFASYYSFNFDHEAHENFDETLLKNSGETVYNKEWLENNDFSTQEEWFYKKGTLGDNSTLDANINNGQANYIVVGKNDTFSVLSGDVNSSTWYGWGIYNNSDYLLPDIAEINATGCYVYHYLDESENGGAGQVHNFPSVHFRKNVTLPVDMSDYEITAASLSVIFNASVNSNVDTPGDSPLPQEAIYDSATFYVEIADLDLSYSFRVAENKTSDLGQDSPPKLTIPDRELTYVSESDLITALNLALEKDPNHSNLTLIMGIDIYCEDNDFPDYDEWKALIFKSFNLTFEYKRKVDKFSSISWNQVGNQITGSNVYISRANLKFKVMIDKDWPTTLSPYSEVRILINENPYSESIRLSSVNNTFQDAKTGGFDIKNLIPKDENISVSIQLFIANTFELGHNITFSIDDVYLNITYVETFPDYGTYSQLFLNKDNKSQDPYIQLPLDNNLNITIKYLNQTMEHITGATVQLEGKISGFLTESKEQYSIPINTSKLGIGLWLLTITAQKTNFETQSIPFYVNVVERSTGFQLFVNNTEKTFNNTVKVRYNEFLNITVFYKDNVTKQHLSGANVTIINVGDLFEINKQYELTINSNSLGFGFNVLTIRATLENFTSQTFQLFVEVFDRATELLLYIDGIQRFHNDVIQVEINQNLNFTVFYRDNITKLHLSGATVQLLTIGNFSEIGNQYNYSLNSINLGLGFNILTIYAKLNNYESQSIQIFVEVYEIASDLLLYINDTQRYDNDIIEVEVNQFLNVTVFYRDNLTKQHLSGAEVQLIGWGNFTEINNQYNFTIDTNDLDQGITILSIRAQLTNYQSQIIQFYIEVIERATEMQLYINNTQRSPTETIQIEVNQLLNVTVLYRDNSTKQHLSGAEVQLIGWGNFTEINNQYNFTIDTNDLDQGITILTVFAHLDNFQPQTFQFYVEVIERSSRIELFLNDINKTIDPVIDLPLGSFLNITVRFTDNETSNHINGAQIILIDSEFSENFTEIISLNQYELYLNTSNLKIGVNLLTIIAQANNFQIKNLNLRITVNKIRTLINTTSGESYINKKVGEDIALSIVLYNVDFGGTIKNAVVTYRWAYGQAELYDLDNDGVYEGELSDIPIGTYIITITAFVGDIYDFKSYELTLIVEPTAVIDLSWLFFTLIGAFVGIIIILTLFLTHFKYPPLVRKIRKLKKKVRKGRKIKQIVVEKRENIIETNLKEARSVLDLESIYSEKEDDISNLKL